MSASEKNKILLEGIPSKPGCYLMKDAVGKVLYVGKANSLRSRVRSYFHTSAHHSPRIAEMVGRVEDIEWILVGSELEALILEMNLIKRHRPKYNVHLKDDKRYPYIRIHWSDPFPKVTVTRRMVQDGSRYYGPYTSVWAVHQTLDVLRKVFPYLTCDRVITGEDLRACLYYDIKLCLGPCIGAIDQEGYRGMVRELSRFLAGYSEPIIQRLKSEMESASTRMEYERAATLRDQLVAIDKVVEGHKVISTERKDSDVIAFAREKDDTCVQVFFIRNGKLIGREYFILDGAGQVDDEEVVRSFVKQFYTEAAYIPSRILLPTEIEEARIIETWLRDRKEGNKVELIVPKRGAKRSLVELAAENAAETLGMLRARWEADRSKHVEAMTELKETLNLTSPPLRIEGYDISNLQGTAAAGSMVVFEQGAPRKAHYRKFTIKSVQGQDDFASMEEVLRRRFKRWEVTKEESKKPGVKLDPSFGVLPDLVLVDGGKGQLGRAIQVLQGFGLAERVPVVGLAKSHEELYVPYKRDPILLPRRSQALYLVQRIRDEAHRFALTHHRTRRRKEGISSKLEGIEGIGPKRRKALLKAFGSLESIRGASVDEIESVQGFSRQLAERVKTAVED
jgi:excinuclease ABC subunit C